MILLLAIILSVLLGSVTLETKEALAIMFVFQNKCLATRVKTNMGNSSRLQEENNLPNIFMHAGVHISPVTSLKL